MRRISLTVIIASAVAVLGIGRTDGQDIGRLRYIPSPNEIEAFFHGQIPNNNPWAFDNARYLHLMEEGPLVSTPTLPKVYRLLIQTRPHNIPVLVRLSVHTDGAGESVVKASQSSRFADVLTTNRTASVSYKDVDEFLKLVMNSDFWSMPALQPVGINRRVAMDEAGWMLEAEKEGSYHVACRSTPTLASLRNAVMFLLIHIGKVDLASAAMLPGDAK